MKQLPTYVTIPFSVFLGAGAGALQGYDPHAFFSLATAKPALMGALLAGLIAVVHYYQVPALQPAPEVKS